MPEPANEPPPDRTKMGLHRSAEHGGLPDERPPGDAEGGSHRSAKHGSYPVTMPQLDAEALYVDLASAVRGLAQPDAALVGIWSGGAWLAERLQRDLQLGSAHGVVSSALHRDDFASRGLTGGADHTQLPFEVNGRHIVLVDDVLYTGRTIRAAINELYDFGRPASVALVVLVDRGGRELPIAASYAAASVAMPPGQRLRLVRDAAGRFSFDVREAA